MENFIGKKRRKNEMELFCRHCGFLVKGENLRLGHLVRDVYSCTNRHCHRSVLHYVQDKAPLPTWVRPSLQEYKKAN